jgi:multidrug efflux pump subunit AcrB
LWLFGFPYSVFAFIGLIMLLGLVTKNAILLLDYANVLVRRGLAVHEAAEQSARTRFRPVLMTAVSTILGMMPIALGFGAGGEVRAALGISVAAGLLGATALTLIVIPVVFTLVDDGRVAGKRLLTRAFSARRGRP